MKRLHFKVSQIWMLHVELLLSFAPRDLAVSSYSRKKYTPPTSVFIPSFPGLRNYPLSPHSRTQSPIHSHSPPLTQTVSLHPNSPPLTHPVSHSPEQSPTHPHSPHFTHPVPHSPIQLPQSPTQFPNHPRYSICKQT